MERLCTFVIENINVCKYDKLIGEINSHHYFSDIDNCLTIIKEKLNIDDLILDFENKENRPIIRISFIYNNRKCEIYEIIGVNITNIAICLYPIE